MVVKNDEGGSRFYCGRWKHVADFFSFGMGTAGTISVEGAEKPHER